MGIGGLYTGGRDRKAGSETYSGVGARESCGPAHSPTKKSLHIQPGTTRQHPACLRLPIETPKGRAWQGVSKVAFLPFEVEAGPQVAFQSRREERSQDPTRLSPCLTPTRKKSLAGKGEAPITFRPGETQTGHRAAWP